LDERYVRRIFRYAFLASEIVESIVDGLTESDFILAAKLDQLAQ
jgi:pterin-4a-carbinolamine dehydratase